MTQQQYALVFPGQGSQAVGMLKEIAAAYPEVKQTFAEASAVLSYDLWQLCESGPAEQLDNTVFTQPALLAASYAIWRILHKKLATKPAFLAGHSLGEYTALVCADAIEFTDAIQLVAARGQYMQEAVAAGVGAMAAIIGLDEEAVNRLCEDALDSKDEILAPANYNSIGQIVIAGHKPAVLAAILLAKERGAKLVALIPVSVPSHCELMRGAAAKLAQNLANCKLQMPTLPVINNVDALAYNSLASIREGLIRQLYSPVRWVNIIQYLVQQGITQIIECGPGKVLTGLNKRIDKQLTLLTTMDVEGLSATLLKLQSEENT